MEKSHKKPKIFLFFIFFFWSPRARGLWGGGGGKKRGGTFWGTFLKKENFWEKGNWKIVKKKKNFFSLADFVKKGHFFRMGFFWVVFGLNGAIFLNFFGKLGGGAFFFIVIQYGGNGPGKVQGGGGQLGGEKIIFFCSPLKQKKPVRNKGKGF